MTANGYPVDTTHFAGVLGPSNAKEILVYNEHLGLKQKARSSPAPTTHQVHMKHNKTHNVTRISTYVHLRALGLGDRGFLCSTHPQVAFPTNLPICLYLVSYRPHLRLQSPK